MALSTSPIGRKRPELGGDDQSGGIWQTARLSVSDEEIARLGDGIVSLPGMPVDVLIQTSERTVLLFLVKPITDHIARAFIEE